MAAPSDSFRRMMSLHDKDGNTNIHHLASDGKLYLIHDNLKTGVKIDIRNHKGETPLYLALSQGHLEVACLLLQHGCDPCCRPKNHTTSPLLENLRNSEEITAAQLMLAAQYHLSEKVEEEKTLLEGEEIQTRSEPHSTNLLQFQRWFHKNRKTSPWISLRNLTRVSIRRHLSRKVTKGRSIVMALQSLPIPPVLRSFILFEINDDVIINMRLMMKEYIENEAFGWEKMLCEIEEGRSEMSPAEDLVMEQICDRPVTKISERTRQRVTALLAESADVTTPLRAEDEDELIQQFLVD